VVAACGVIEDAPNGLTGVGRGNQLLRELLESIRTVFGVVDARRAMQPRLYKAVPSTWLWSCTRNRRVGGSAADAKLRQ
jgi:hypothetical protein